MCSFVDQHNPRYKNLNYWSTLKLVLASLSVDSCVECLADKCIYIYICMYVRLQDLQVLGHQEIEAKSSLDFLMTLIKPLQTASQREGWISNGQVLS